MNAVGHEAGNPEMTDGRDLPWLQDWDVDANGIGDVEELWEPQYRDLFILNPRHELVGVFNLTIHNLGVESERSELKRLLRDAAKLVDTDHDGLSDVWEEDPRFGVGDLSATPSTDRDGDSATDFSEYAFGSRASDASSIPTTVIGVVEIEGERYPTITFQRRLGRAGGLSYHVEFSSSLEHWVSGPGVVVEVRTLNRFDGTATVTFRTAQPVSRLHGGGFLRVRCEL